MRMTNKIMQNNSLYNINQTKIAEDTYTTQMTSQSKINRPSDDPVVAIRALRLRTNVTEVTQYYEKNAPDANQWLDVTAGALSTVTDILTNLYKQAEKGFNKELKSDDLKVILDQMKAYTKEFYATGNQDYAGRYIFTGYRTDMELTFTKAAKKEYQITERFDEKALDELNYTDSKTGIGDKDETKVANGDLHRLRLSYKNITNKDFAINIVDKDGKVTELLKDDLAEKKTGEAAAAILEDQKAEEAAKEEKGYYDPESGEILLTDKAYEKIKEALEAGGQIQVSYNKTKWEEGDLHPEHFFQCTDVQEDITYNEDFDVNKIINYDVGYNQKIQVNTNANEVFKHGLKRDMDDLTKAIADLDTMEAAKKELEKKLSGLTEGSDAYKEVQSELDATTKAYDYTRENVKNLFGAQMTKYQNYLDDTNLAITKNGTRSSRLEMISARLMEQKSTYKELQEDNEGIDMTETAVKLASAKLTYDAALQATSKILQNSLMNYI